MKKKSLFVLVPPRRYTLEMPNLGDRALQEGMKNLLAASHDGAFVYDEWNSFPRMTLPRLVAGKQAASERLAQWQDSFKSQAQTTAPLQQLLSNLLLGPACAWLPVWPLLDRESFKRTGQTGREAVAPRLFPGLAARTFATRLAASDAVIMNAGGLLADHLAHYLPGRLFALAAAQMAGKPTALANYSFAVTEPDLLAWVGPIIRAIDLHAVRESHSRERLLALGVDPDRIVVVPDAAFAVDPPALQPKEQFTVALQVRGDRPADIGAWAALIRELRSRFDARIAFLIGCRKYDPPVISRLQSASALDVVAGQGGLNDLREAIGKADLLISDRYHGAVFATQMGTPFIPLAGTTLKTAGLIADLGYKTEVHPPLTRQGIPAILSAASTALADRERNSAHLLNQAAHFKMRLFDDYANIIERLLSMTDTGKPAPE